MSETVDQRTKETLRSYIRDVKSLPNESAKRQRFAALIGELFPGTNAVTEYARGVEKLIRITRVDGERRGHADAYYGNVIIEFEKSLSATLGEAEGQLREYVAGTWQQDKGLRHRRFEFGHCKRSNQRVATFAKDQGVERFKPRSPPIIPKQFIELASIPNFGTLNLGPFGST